MPFPFGAILSGDPVGAYQKSKAASAKNQQDELDQQYTSLAGKALQDMFQSQVPGAGPVPGGGIQPVQPVQGLGGGSQQAAGGPGQPPPPGGPGGQPPIGGVPGGGQDPATAQFGPGSTITGVEVNGQPTQGPPIGQGQGALTPGRMVPTQSFTQQPPGGQAPGGGQPPPGGGQSPPGGGQQQLGQGPLTLQQAVQSIVRAAGPKANPQVVFGALNKMLPALNAQGLEQYRTLSEQLRMMQMQQQAREFYYGKGQQESQFKERQAAGGGGAGRTVAGQMYNKFFQEHPDATVEEYADWVKSQKPTTATELKQQAGARSTQSVSDQIDSALRDVQTSFKSGPYVTGAAGALERGKEVVGNIAGWTDETKAADFQTKLQILKLEALREIAGSTRLTKDDRDKADQIVRGLGMGATRQATISGLSYLKQVLQSKGTPSQGPKPGTVEDGYQFKGGDPSDKNNWKPLSGGKGAGPFDKRSSLSNGKVRLAMSDDITSDAPPPGFGQLSQEGKVSPSEFLNPTPGMPGKAGSVSQRLKAAYDKILNTSPKYSEHVQLGKRPPIDASRILKSAGVTPEELFAAHNAGELEGMKTASSTYSKVGGKPVVIRHPDGREKASYYGLIFDR